MNSNNVTNSSVSWNNLTTEMPTTDSSLRFIFVPLAVLVTIIFLSAMVFLMARNRRKLTNLYRRVQVPNFSFDDGSDLEDNEDPTECLLAGKLQIENSYDSYQIQTYNEKHELYT